MRIVAVSGPHDEAEATVDRLADRLTAEGAVVVVSDADEGNGPTSPDLGAVRSRYAVGEGRFRGTEPGGLEAVLDRLASDHEFAVLTGFPETDVPRVLVGTERGDTDDEQVIAVAHRAETLDLDRVVGALAERRPHETLQSLVTAVKDSPAADRAGAIATFTGRVRAHDTPDDPRTEHLEFDAHEGLAERRLADLRSDLESREGVLAVRLHHRRGVVEAGEDIVFVVVLAGHRAAAFGAVEDGIDRLKSEVPLFKREVTVEGEFWAHQHDDDAV